ncbi:terpenoid synthase [Dendrothele bispora CBS 962.96]|uniref:Terpene synthase n=1 Tax=Dendrothele bispora (strain CBS 962.96) TaxID=1314807 RepID=A0A4S8LHE3_DENBC|nr:terpenoid synthase [Dendrothele bispora CBS 962.96]
MAASVQTYFILPDLLNNWPFDHEPNPCNTIVLESAQWAESYGAFDKRAQDAFNRCNFGYFSSLAYSRAREDHYRVGCDLMNFFFVFDELSDNASGDVAAQQAADIMNAIRYPDIIPPGGDSILGSMARDLWKRTIQCSSCSSTERLIRNFDEYTNAVRQQAVEREAGYHRNLQEYYLLRRGTIGVRLSFDFFLLPDDLSDEVLAHPTIEKLVVGAIDMTILANDIYSYNKEQAVGDDIHNIVSVIMTEKNFTIQQAMDYVDRLYVGMREEFLKNYENLPLYDDPSLNSLVQEYCWGVCQWTTTNIKWSFKSERYFGKEGLNIMQHRRVALRPKEVPIVSRSD